MEHDSERNIREKILEIERQPVLWRKEEVWRRIHQGEKPARVGLTLLKTAACISFFIVIATYFYQRSQTGNMYEKLTQLEKEYASQRAIHTNEAPQQRPEENCPSGVSEVISEQKVMPIEELQTEAITQRSNDTTLAQLPPILQEVTYENDTSKIENAVAMETPIQPIIGVVITSEKRLVTVEKRRKIKLMPPIHPLYDGKDKRSTPILARIK